MIDRQMSELQKKVVFNKGIPDLGKTPQYQVQVDVEALGKRSYFVWSCPGAQNGCADNGVLRKVVPSCCVITGGNVPLSYCLKEQRWLS
jgi:hypothetical protein